MKERRVDSFNFFASIFFERAPSDAEVQKSKRRTYA